MRIPYGENLKCASEHKEDLKHDFTKEILFLAIEMFATASTMEVVIQSK